MTKKHAFLNLKQGMPGYVVLHAAWQRRRGKNLSEALGGNRNPRLAFWAAESQISRYREVRRFFWASIKATPPIFKTPSVITQEEYQKDLDREEELRRTFTSIGSTLPEIERWRCFCGAEARHVFVEHSIFSGPLSKMWRDAEDTRSIPYCSACEGPKPQTMRGAPIHIPHVVGENIRGSIIPRLWARMSSGDSLDHTYL